MQYVLRDHLGSVDVLTDADGAVDSYLRFDAWGLRQNAASGRNLTATARMDFDTCATTRGFTGHEMLDQVGVVHMNGRIYDPNLARFLQADPYVQFPNDLQSHNRYSYVMNNPLAHTDPSGHEIFTLTAMFYVATKAAIDWYVAAAIIGAAGFADAMVQGASFEQALQSGFLSGISAAAFAGIGNLVGTHFGGTFGAGLSPTGFGLKVALHGTVGGITSVLGGGKFGHGFAAAGFTALGASFNNSNYIGRKGFSPLRVAIGATIGGTASRITGGKFVNGAVSGAFSQAFNNEQRERQNANTPTVIVVEPWVEPAPSDAKPKTVTERENKRNNYASPYRRSRASEAEIAEIRSTIETREFSSEAGSIWKASFESSRELGALTVYKQDGVYKVYSIGTPDPKVSNRMTVDEVNADLGRHVFDWHPHPGENPQPSPADLKTSFNTGVPGAIQWNSRVDRANIYQGACKRGREC